MSLMYNVQRKEEPMQNVNFRMECAKVNELSQLCLKRNWIRSDMIRVAIEEFVAKHDNASFEEEPRVIHHRPVQQDFQFIDAG